MEPSSIKGYQTALARAGVRLPPGKLKLDEYRRLYAQNVTSSRASPARAPPSALGKRKASSTPKDTNRSVAPRRSPSPARPSPARPSPNVPLGKQQSRGKAAVPAPAATSRLSPRAEPFVPSPAPAAPAPAPSWGGSLFGGGGGGGNAAAAPAPPPPPAGRDAAAGRATAERAMQERAAAWRVQAAAAEAERVAAERARRLQEGRRSTSPARAAHAPSPPRPPPPVLVPADHAAAGPAPARPAAPFLRPAAICAAAAGLALLLAAAAEEESPAHQRLEQGLASLGAGSRSLAVSVARGAVRLVVDVLLWVLGLAWQVVSVVFTELLALAAAAVGEENTAAARSSLAALRGRAAHLAANAALAALAAALGGLLLLLAWRLARWQWRLRARRAASGRYMVASTAMSITPALLAFPLKQPLADLGLAARRAPAAAGSSSPAGAAAAAGDDDDDDDDGPIEERLDALRGRMRQAAAETTSPGPLLECAALMGRCASRSYLRDRGCHRISARG